MKDTVTDVFFDLDHTLWDFEKNSALTFKKIFEENMILLDLDTLLDVYRPLNLEYWKLYRDEQITKEKLRYGRLRSAFDALSYPVEDDLINTLSSRYVAELPNYTYLFKDTIAVLDYLKPNYTLHIITNGFEEVQHKKLNGTAIRHYFTHIITSESVGVKKPNPLIFEHALEKASVAAHNTVMIGDSLEADILGAKRMGMKTVHFNHYEEAHDHGVRITALSEIKQYL